MTNKQREQKHRQMRSHLSGAVLHSYNKDYERTMEEIKKAAIILKKLLE
jgi:hypothetical protein